VRTDHSKSWSWTWLAHDVRPKTRPPWPDLNPNPDLDPFSNTGFCHLYAHSKQLDSLHRQSNT
jgi:hypothetical protein